MSRTMIDVSAVIGAAGQINAAKSYVGSARSSFTQTKNNLDPKILNRSNIWERMNVVQCQLSNIDSKIGRIGSIVYSGAIQYRVTDEKVESARKALKNSVTAHWVIDTSSDWLSHFKETKKDKNKEKIEVKKQTSSKKEKMTWWSWNNTLDMMGEAGILGSMLSTVGQLITGGLSTKSKWESAKSAAKVVEHIAGAWPKSTSSFDWKKLVGLNEQITNQSPTSFLKGLRQEIDDLKFSNAKTVSGKIAIGAKWAGHALTAITTTYENFAEEENSFGRKVAESIGETTVKITTGAAISVGLATGLATLGVAAPAVVVGVASVGVAWAINKGCEAFFGDDLAEVVSDFALDTGEFLVDSVATGAKKLSGAVSGWWNRTFG